jgi:hypothetical protein
VEPGEGVAVQFVVTPDGQHIAALLPIETYNHYLELLEDEADSQNAELATRLEQAAKQPVDTERQSFRDYLHQRGVDDAGLPSSPNGSSSRHRP